MANEKNKPQEESKKLALEYHAKGRPGKIEVISSKSCVTSHDLSLAYTPGVAEPCLAIAADPELAYSYTAKGNLVAVISNGSAVLGLGDIGPLAGKPVMEGKGILFKRFADIDVFDLEIKANSVEEMVNTVKALEPTFGGINLEDIKAPECFEVEQQLQKLMDIPVFHDDQHGTAIIGAAAFINALEITKRDIKKVKVVFSGAGAAAIACANLFIKMGVKKENLILCDSKGVIYEGRVEGMNKYKQAFQLNTKLRTLEEALDGADAFVGVSARGVVTKDMVKKMAKQPIIFAMANPYPEIYPHEVAEVRNDAIMATGRSDFPNQVNNVLGFPFIFRGALDVRATKINDEMKLAAVKALAELAKEEVPEDVKNAYNGAEFTFGPNYLIPKPFDKRVLTRVTPAVAKAAMESGVARKPILDFDKYRESLEVRLGSNQLTFLRSIRDKIKQEIIPSIVFSEGHNSRILSAVSTLMEEKRFRPILLGNPANIHRAMEKNKLGHLKELVEIIEPTKHPQFAEFVDEFYRERQRKGVSHAYARELMATENYFGSMLVKKKIYDGMITGASNNYAECFRPIVQVVGTAKNKKASGVIILTFKNRIIFLADCTVQMDPTAEDLADTANATAELYMKLLGKKPHLAFLSFSNFGASNHPEAKKMVKACELTQKMNPDLVMDGEVQADVAVNTDILKGLFAFSKLDRGADILIFPNLSASNIGYKLLIQLGGAHAIGPILVPLDNAINIVQRTSTVTEIVNMTVLTGVMSQVIKENKSTKQKK